MKVNKLFRFFFLPLGLLLKIYELALDGSRDIYNKLRFKNATIDRNCCISHSCKISPHCHILENSFILNSIINSYSYVGRNSLVQNASIGSFCSIANDVHIGLGSHPIDYFSTSPLTYRVANTFKIKLVDQNYDFEEYNKIEIGNDVWIGFRAVIMDGVKIGDGAIVAAGAVVTKDIPPYAIVGGIPAKIINHRFEPEKIKYLLDLKWWNLPLSEIKKNINELNKI